MEAASNQRSQSHAERMMEKRRVLAELKANRAADIRVKSQSMLDNHAKIKKGDDSLNASQLMTNDYIDSILTEVGIVPSSENAAPSNVMVVPEIVVQQPSLCAIESLSLTSVKEVDICSKEKVLYSRNTQTDSDCVEFVDEPSTPNQEFHDEVVHDQGCKESLPAECVGEPIVEEAPREKCRILGEDEVSEIYNDSKFEKFIFHANKLLARSIASDFGIDRDYNDFHEIKAKNRIDLALLKTYCDPKWSTNRTVTGISMNVVLKDLFAVSYDHKVEDTEEFPGVIIVWNSKFTADTPEFIFTENSRITSITYARFQPHLLLAGCFSGHISVWDSRVQPKKSPVGKSRINTNCHTQPVYALTCSGAQNTHQLFSVSTDGRLCSWSVDNVVTPNETRDLSFKKGGSSSSIQTLSVYTFDVPEDDAHYVCVGCADGGIYRLSWMSPNNEGEALVYDGHKSAVTKLEFNKAKNHAFSHLFLTCSIDWTVRLWNLKENAALYSMEEHMDGVMDVAWSPTHPGVFASIDAAGFLFVCNLAAANDICVAQARVSEDGALTKISFSSNGDSILVGDMKGNVFGYSVSESLQTPTDEDIAAINSKLMECRKQLDEC